MLRTLVSPFFALVLASASCFGLGADHKNGDLPPHDGWPAGVFEAVNQTNRIHGYWVNSLDTLFYKGSSQQLNEMVGKLSATSAAPIKVVLHASAGSAKSPWSETPIGPADWSVTIAGDGAITRVQDRITIDVWLGGAVILGDLALPSTVTVASGGEIEVFINLHNSAQRK